MAWLRGRKDKGITVDWDESSTNSQGSKVATTKPEYGCWRGWKMRFLTCRRAGSEYGVCRCEVDERHIPKCIRKGQQRSNIGDPTREFFAYGKPSDEFLEFVRGKGSVYLPFGASGHMGCEILKLIAKYLGIDEVESR